jgi:hypothetical protein
MLHIVQQKIAARLIAFEEFEFKWITSFWVHAKWCLEQVIHVCGWMPAQGFQITGTVSQAITQTLWKFHM